MASFRWILQLHRDVPRAARFYSEGLDFAVNVCTLRWAELESGPLKLALMQAPNDDVMQKGYSSLLSFKVTDINNTVTKLVALGAELDGPIKHEIHGKADKSPHCVHRSHAKKRLPEQRFVSALEISVCPCVDQIITVSCGNLAWTYSSNDTNSTLQPFVKSHAKASAEAETSYQRTSVL